MISPERQGRYIGFIPIRSFERVIIAESGVIKSNLIEVSSWSCAEFSEQRRQQKAVVMYLPCDEDFKI